MCSRLMDSPHYLEAGGQTDRQAFLFRLVSQPARYEVSVVAHENGGVTRQALPALDATEVTQPNGPRPGLARR